MGGGRRGAPVGCAVLGLVGLLAGVALTVWLSSRVIGPSTGAADRSRERGAETTRPADPIDPGVAVGVEPASGLVDGQRVHVSSTAFPAGASVTVRQCLTPSAGTALVLGDGSTCDAAATPVSATVGTDGGLEVDVVVRLVVTSGALPFDCATEPGTCSLLVSTTSADDPVVGSATLAFAAGAGPELTLPGG